MNGAASAFFRLCRQRSSRATNQHKLAILPRAQLVPQTKTAKLHTQTYTSAANETTVPLQEQQPPRTNSTTSSLPVLSNTASPPSPTANLPSTPSPDPSSTPNPHRKPPFHTGTVTTATLIPNTVTVTTRRLTYHAKLHIHRTRLEKHLVHDPDSLLRVGDVITYTPFSLAERTARIERRVARGVASRQRGAKGRIRGQSKGSVKFVLDRVVTPFGVAVEERTPVVAEGKAQRKIDASPKG